MEQSAINTAHSNEVCYTQKLNNKNEYPPTISLLFGKLNTNQGI